MREHLRLDAVALGAGAIADAAWELAPARPRARTRSLERSWIWICPAVVLVVGLLDTAFTLAALQLGVLVELNPVMALMIDVGGAVGLGLYRLTMTMLGCGLLLWALRMYRDGRIRAGSSGRVRRIVWIGQSVLVATHVALAAWWTAWFLV